MSSTFSVSGLASGLDTASIVNQLMQLEAGPQQRLQKALGTAQLTLSSLRTVNSNIATIATRADALTKTDAWKPMRATSSSEGVKVTATSSAQPAGYDLTVDAVARSHQLGFTDAAGLGDVVVGGGSTHVRLERSDGSSIDLDTGDGTLRGLADALNDKANATGVHASVVQVSGGSYRLLVESDGTGSAAAFGLANADGSALLGGATVRAAQDARVSFATGITATSATNTFADLLPGVTITLSASNPPGSEVTITVARDTSAMTVSVKSFIEAINTSLSEIGNLTKYNPETKSAGVLAGTPGLTSIRDRLAGTVFGASSTTSLKAVGIELDRYGALTFDEAAFSAAYDADPDAVAAMFTGADGFATRVQTFAKAASDPTDGMVTSLIASKESGIGRMKDDIATWDVRLQVRRDALNRQFSALETALSQMQGQSSWLAGQLGSLSSSQG